MEKYPTESQNSTKSCSAAAAADDNIWLNVVNTQTNKRQLFEAEEEIKLKNLTENK
jgi:hypothetical protein